MAELDPTSVIAQNIKAYNDEIVFAFGILRQDRHSSVYPYRWYGPSEESCDAGPSCKCSGCTMLFHVRK